MLHEPDDVITREDVDAALADALAGVRVSTPFTEEFMVALDQLAAGDISPEQARAVGRAAEGLTYAQL